MTSNVHLPSATRSSRAPVYPAIPAPQEASRSVSIADLFVRTGEAGKSARVRPSETQALVQELEALLTELETTQYGPASKKPKLIGFDWTAFKSEFRERMKSLTTMDQFYFMCGDMYARLNDAHTSMALPSSRTFALPVQFKSLGNEGLIVNYVSADADKSFDRVPQVGDMFVGIDGMTPEAFQKRYSEFNKFGNGETNTAMFVRNLSHVTEEQGISLSDFPKELSLTMRTASGETYTTKATFEDKGVGLIGHRLRNSALETFASSAKFMSVDDQKPSVLRTLESNPIFAEALKAVGAADIERFEKVAALMDKINALCDLCTSLPSAPADKSKGQGKQIELGHKEPTFPLPADFKRISLPLGMDFVVNGSAMFAGTFEHNGKRVGLLRIGSYMPNLIYAAPVLVRYYIKKLQESSDVLLIDQEDNPGGAVVFSDMIIKGLCGKLDPDKHMKFEVKPTQTFLRQYAELLNELETMKDGEGLSAAARADLIPRLQADYDRIKKAYDNGDELSEPISMWVLSAVIDELLTTNPIMKLVMATLGLHAEETYTKPVDFLINETCFSGGDATPANFQDYGRGRLIGVATAGAGGSVEEHQHRGLAEFIYRLTASLMRRFDGSYVENNRVHPTIDFRPTAQDVRDGYVNYLPRLLKALGL